MACILESMHRVMENGGEPLEPGADGRVTFTAKTTRHLAPALAGYYYKRAVPDADGPYRDFTEVETQCNVAADAFYELIIAQRSEEEIVAGEQVLINSVSALLNDTFSSMLPRPVVEGN